MPDGVVVQTVVVVTGAVVGGEYVVDEVLCDDPLVVVVVLDVDGLGVVVAVGLAVVAA